MHYTFLNTTHWAAFKWRLPQHQAVLQTATIVFQSALRRKFKIIYKKKRERSKEYISRVFKGLNKRCRTHEKHQITITSFRATL
jgi:hypothetical protein